jgi:hypothetical protein
MTNDVVARVEGVTHCYGKTFALNDLTLDIPAGIVPADVELEGAALLALSR